ncbi:MAG: LptF/LptG family permease [Deltaproteobacteria bacterium]|nr:LptF/LptG family permease [Deltaproteobacteria bacterium]
MTLARPRLINFSVIGETIPSFLVNLLAFTFILLMARVMSLTDLVVGKGVEARVIFRVFFLILPKMLSMSIPMAALLASLTTFLRMSADSEITVLKASGVSLRQLLPPVVAFGLTAAFITGLFNVWLTPKANVLFREEIMALAKARADLAIKEQVFVREFPGLTIYVGQLPTNSEAMANIVINDRRSPGENTLVVARTGILDVDLGEQMLLFQLHDGVIDRMFQDRQSVDSIFFDTYELKLSPGSEFDSAGDYLALGRSEMPTWRLRAEAEKLRLAERPGFRVYLLEWHRRYSFPVAAFLMAIVGVPLGASFRTKGRNFGLIVGLGVFVLYYALFSLGWSLGETGTVPPGLAVWAPVFLALTLVVALLKGIDQLQPIDPSEAWARWLRHRRKTKGGGL